jgi:hypothetical protein
LINVATLLPAAVQQQLEKRLGGPVFVGLALGERDASAVVARLDDAAAEASARILAGASSTGRDGTAKKRRILQPAPANGATRARKKRASKRR